MNPIRVLLADDHVVVREAVRRFLEASPGIGPVQGVSHGNDALALLLRDRPDVLVTDIEMPGRTCFDIADVIRSMELPTRVVLLTGFASDFYVSLASRAGIRAFVTKDDAPERLIEAVRLAAQGRSYCSPQVRERLERALANAVAGAQGIGHAADALSLREKEVLVQLARGLSIKEVASLLSLSRKTVDNHTQRVMAKLDIHTRADLVRYAVRERLISA
jgi:DNA-binding NarL/FixJ family response regulator